MESELQFAIEIKQLTKVYDGKVNALDGVDLTVKAAGIFALLGPNGSGKTTLMRVLTTQFRPTAGVARAFGYDVVKDDAMVRKIIGYVPQEMSVWTDITGYENLLIYAKIYGVPSSRRTKSIWDALQSMGLEDVAGGAVKKYSGGMIRRLEIACALLIKPKILFLDEPTLGLDPSARKAVWQSLEMFKKEYGTTVFFNTHYMDEADQYSDEVAIINRGKIVKSGTAGELKSSLHSEVIKFTLANHGVDFKHTFSSVADAKNVDAKNPDLKNSHLKNANLNNADRNNADPKNADPKSRLRLLETIKALDFVDDVFIHDLNLDVVVEDGDVALPIIIEVLRGQGIGLERISVTKPSLDDVFLKYAGMRHPKDKGGNAA
jgi:ABC-2 type transport system ATP-binding protein